MPCREPENVNGDAKVNFADILRILANWGCTGDPCMGGDPFDVVDINGNGEVEFGDILAILAAWTACDPFPVPVEFCKCCDGPCDADLDGDGVVGFLDLLVLLGAWGSNDPDADINCNGVVESGDLIFLIINLGTECPL